MTRPVVLGVVGDSAAGKTTLTRGVVRVLGGREHVSYISGDDYHRYGREQRNELGITPLNPAANHLDYQTSFERTRRQAGLPIHRGLWQRVFSPTAP